MAQTNSHTAESCGLYIDVENLQNDAQELVGSLINNWPLEKVPRPTQVTLYVRADMVELWNAWTMNIPAGIRVNVKGIQHFTIQQSKNSADIAIALDAVTDLFKQRANHVAVLSDDSDFISLFAKVRTEIADTSNGSGRVPFLWIMTDRDGTKTPNMERFFPKEYVHFIAGSSTVKALTDPANSVTSELIDEKATSAVGTTPEENIAKAIIKEMPLGRFKSTDCRTIIRRTAPGNPLANLPDNQLGVQFLDRVWPFLKSHGVELPRTKPNRYEITQVAKDSLSH